MNQPDTIKKCFEDMGFKVKVYKVSWFEKLLRRILKWKKTNSNR